MYAALASLVSAIEKMVPFRKRLRRILLCGVALICFFLFSGDDVSRLRLAALALQGRSLPRNVNSKRRDGPAVLPSGEGRRRGRLFFTHPRVPNDDIDRGASTQRLRRPSKRADLSTRADATFDPRSRTARGYQRRKAVQTAAVDLSFLHRLASVGEIDAWMHGLNCECIDDSMSKGAPHASVAESSLPTRRDLASWSSRDETALVSTLRDRGAIAAALDFVRHVAHHRNVYLYTAAITAVRPGHLLSTGDNHQEACCSILDEMDRHAVQPSPSTLTALFQAYCLTALDATSLQTLLLNRYPRAIWTEPVWEAAIYSCVGPMSAKDGGGSRYSNIGPAVDADSAWETAVGFYDGFLKQLSARTRGDECSSSAAKYRKVPSEQIYVAMFHVCAEIKDATKAISFLVKLQSQSLPDASSFRMSPRLWASVLKVCALTGDHVQGRRVLERMCVIRQFPNVRHCTAYLKALVESNETETASAFLEHMAADCASEREMPRKENCNATIDFSNIRVAAPDMIAVKTVLSGCASAGNFALARKILDQVKVGFFGTTIQLDEQCYNTALAACDEPELAKELVREMRLTRRHRIGVIPPSMLTFTRAIAVCRKAKDVESARFFLRSARNDGVVPDAYMYSGGTRLKSTIK